jgi:hypothetical protein
MCRHGATNAVALLLFLVVQHGKTSDADSASFFNFTQIF